MLLLPLLCSHYSLRFPDGHQRELPDHVGHYLQSLTPPASCDTHQDRLEQDPELQNWQGDAERLEATESNRRLPPQTTPPRPLPDNIAWLDSCFVFVKKFKNRDKERFGSHEHIGYRLWAFSTGTVKQFSQCKITPVRTREKIWRHRTGSGHLYAKHPCYIHVQYLLCQWDPAFHLTCQQKRFKFATAWQTFLEGGKLLSTFEVLGLKKKLLKSLTPFLSQFLFLDGLWGKNNPNHFLCIHWWYLWHKRSPLSATQCSCSLLWYFPHFLSCVRVLRLTVLLAKSSFWLDII